MRTVVTSFLSHLFFVIVTGISITACEHKGNGEYWLKDDPEFSESLISDYVRVDESNPIQIVPFSDDCFVSSRQLVLIAHVNPFQHDQKLFDTMKRRYDDTHYNGFVSGVVSQRNHSYSNDFTGVDLISDTEYNDLRAGESLGGYCALLFRIALSMAEEWQQRFI